MNELTRRLFETLLLFQKMHMSVILPDNLTKNDYYTLKCIEYIRNENNADNSVSISALANMLRVSAAAVSRNVSTLEERGILLRKRDTNDRRNTYVELTSQGKEILMQAQIEMDNFLNQIVHNMDKEDMEHLIEYLTKIYENAFAEYERRKQEKKERNSEKN